MSVLVKVGMDAQLASAYMAYPLSEAFSRLETLVERQEQPATPGDRAQQDRPPQRDGVVLPRLASCTKRLDAKNGNV